MARRKIVDPNTLRDDAYYAALGRFISEFAQTEAMLAMLLRVEAGLGPTAAAALLSGSFRVDQAKTLVVRLREAKGLQIEPDLKRAFEQLTLITTARNALMHYASAVVDGDDLWLTNSIAAHKPAKLQMTLVSKATLEAMTYDLGLIQGSLLLPQLRDMFKRGSASSPLNRGRRRLPKQLENIFQDVAQRAFLYKPAQPAPTLKQRQTKGLAPPRPRRSSRPKPPEPPPPKREK